MSLPIYTTSKGVQAGVLFPIAEQYLITIYLHTSNNVKMHLPDSVERCNEREH